MTTSPAPVPGDVTGDAATLGYPTLTDAGRPVDPDAVRLLPRSAPAVAVSYADGVVEVVVDHLPTAAEILAYERVSGCAVTVTVATPAVYRTIAGRAHNTQAGPDISRLLTELGPAVRSVHLVPGQPPLTDRDGTLAPASGWRPLTADDLEVARTFLLPDGVDDATLTWGGRRWNVHARTSAGHGTLVLHAAADPHPALGSLGLPGAFADLADHPSGLVLLASPPGQGRSTTLAALVERVTGTRTVRAVVATTEPTPPTRHNRSLVTHRVVGVDVLDLATLARQALADRTDVLAVDIDSYRHDDVTALTQAALAGMLVLLTVPAASVAGALVSFLADVPDSHRAGVSALLGGAYVAGTAQELLPGTDGGLVAAAEIWWATPALTSALTTGNLTLLPSAAYNGTGARRNTTLADARAALVNAGRVRANRT